MAPSSGREPGCALAESATCGCEGNCARISATAGGGGPSAFSMRPCSISRADRQTQRRAQQNSALLESAFLGARKPDPVFLTRESAMFVGFSDFLFAHLRRMPAAVPISPACRSCPAQRWVRERSQLKAEANKTGVRTTKSGSEHQSAHTQRFIRANSRACRPPTGPKPQAALAIRTLDVLLQLRVVDGVQLSAHAVEVARRLLQYGRQQWRNHALPTAGGSAGCRLHHAWAKGGARVVDVFGAITASCNECNSDGWGVDGAIV